MFSSTVADHWIPAAAAGSHSDEVFVVIDPTLAENRSVSLIGVIDGPTVLTLTQERATQLSLTGESLAATELRGLLRDAGIVLNDPDNVFYLPADQQLALRDEVVVSDTRRLTEEDAPAFALFVADAPEDDLDEAFVELDHWLVYGTFVQGRLVAAASMYPWGATALADLGVITLPAFRGRGLGRTTVRALSAEAIERGYEPQYRCQLENAASVSLAASAGFALFGQWEVIVDGD